jgi:hypothetical protein
MKSTLAELEKRLGQATGPDHEIDKEIATDLDDDCDEDGVPSFTASVDDCIALIKRTLPDWHWHVGHGPMGVVPYASMSRSDEDADAILIEVSAPTVPLALLRALMQALSSRK